MTLMLLWARKKATKNMVRVYADGTEQCFVSFGSDTVSTWVFWIEEPSAFHTAYKSFDLVSVLCAGKTPSLQGMRTWRWAEWWLGRRGGGSLQVIPLIEAC